MFWKSNLIWDIMLNVDENEKNCANETLPMTEMMVLMVIDRNGNNSNYKIFLFILLLMNVSVVLKTNGTMKMMIMSGRPINVINKYFILSSWWWKTCRDETIFDFCVDFNWWWLQHILLWKYSYKWKRSDYWLFIAMVVMMTLVIVLDYACDYGVFTILEKVLLVIDGDHND